MWVSRKRFDALAARVQSLEQGAVIRVPTNPDLPHPTRWFHTVSTKNAVTAILDHLGLRLEVKDAQPERAVVVHKAAK